MVFKKLKRDYKTSIDNKKPDINAIFIKRILIEYLLEKNEKRNSKKNRNF